MGTMRKGSTAPPRSAYYPQMIPPTLKVAAIPESGDDTVYYPHSGRWVTASPPTSP